jgi:hypothetical protein
MRAWDASKAGRDPRDDRDPAGEAAAWGNKLEDTILEEGAARLGLVARLVLGVGDDHRRRVPDIHHSVDGQRRAVGEVYLRAASVLEGAHAGDHPMPSAR